MNKFSAIYLYMPFRALTPIADSGDRRRRDENRSGAAPQVRLALLVDQWGRMGQFYASSIALKRLTGFTEKNYFYRVNVKLGRILKTEDIIYWMTDPPIKGKSLEDINSSGNCTILICLT